MSQFLRTTARIAALALVLFLLNAYCCRQLFGTEYLAAMHSIEAAYVALTHYTMNHWGDLGWFPLWQAGEPYQNAYQPGLQLASAALGSLSGWSPALAYHVTIALFYCLGPVGLFFLARSLTGRSDVAFVAALLMSLVSPSAWFAPEVRNDLGSIWYARRYQALVFYGEGPNVSGLSLVPWAWWGVHAVWSRWSGVRLACTALAAAAVVIVSWPAGVVMVVGVLAYTAAQRPAEWREKWWRLALIGVAAYGLIAPWVPLSTIRDNQRNSQKIGGDYSYTKMHLLYWGLVLIVAVAVRLLLRRRALVLRFSALAFWVLASVALSAYWFRIALMPQPERFHLGMEVPLCLLIASSVLLLRDRRVRIGVLVLVMAAGLFQARRYRRFMDRQTREIDITQTVEYQTARWLDENRHGLRTFAAGSVAFWMNSWSDQPQATGCCLPGMPNPVSWIVGYIIPSDDGAKGREAEISLLWLRAFGAQTVVVGGEQSRNAFRDWRTPRKYESVLPKVWERQDDRIYDVPSRSSGLWHVIHAGDAVARTPENGIDVEPLRPFVRALEDPSLPAVTMRWVNQHEMQGRARFALGQLLHVQATYVPGWHAAVNGQPRQPRRDGIGLMLIDPGVTGDCDIRLWWDGGSEAMLMRLLAAASWLTVLGLLGRGLLRLVRKVR